MHLGTDRVLVTGASGWLGRALVRALLQGLPDVKPLSEPQPDLAIRTLTLPDPGPRPAEGDAVRVETVLGDIRDPGDCARFCTGAAGSILFHTAGVIHPRRARDFIRVNVRGTENLLTAASRAGVRRVVLVSSNSPIGCNPHPDHRFDEESPYHPYMKYGRSKMLMERAANEFQKAGGIDVVIIRAPWFYGPFQPPRQTLFFKMIRDGKVPIVGAGECRRSMAYIDNLCQGLLLAAMSGDARGQTYWIADERPYSMNEIVDTIERLLEAEFGQRCAHQRLRLPGVVSGTARCADWMLQALGLYHPKIHVLSEMNKTIVCSIEKARHQLGYAPAVALEEGMKRSIAYALDEGGGI